MARSVNNGTAPADGNALSVPSRRLGLWAFIGSETLFFGSLIVAYLVYRGTNLARPDVQDPKAFLNLGYTAILTTVLVASSLTMVLALAAIRRGDGRRFRVCLLLTAALGACFLLGQAREFWGLTSQGVTLSSSLFGSTFFVLTGFHGLHVAIGVVWLLAVYVWVALQSRASAATAPENTDDVELVGLYWHFVDLVWVAIFMLVYLI